MSRIEIKGFVWVESVTSSDLSGERSALPRPRVNAHISKPRVCECVNDRRELNFTALKKSVVSKTTSTRFNDVTRRRGE